MADANGLRCPKCDCADLRVYYTRRRPGGRIRRSRICRACGARVISTETITNTCDDDGRRKDSDKK
jgi:transcriptional regulator NrdR family protein